MELVGPETCPLPEHPVLAEIARALNDSGSWGSLHDASWRLVYMTDELRLSNGRLAEMVPVPRTAMSFSSEALDVLLGWSGGVFGIEAWRAMFHGVVGWVVADTEGGAAAVRSVVDPRFADLVGNDVQPDHRSAVTISMPASYTAGGMAIDIQVFMTRVRAADGELIGVAAVSKPAAGMSVLATITSAGDLRHFERVQRLAKHARRPAAILFADLEGSSPLARALSTSSYFALGRRIVRAADGCVVDAGGMVGRHVGDGVVAFFLAETCGSESKAARSCIEAMRDLRAQLRDVAISSGLAPEQVVLRFGLHWGSTLHIGQITTPARAEVNALGDEVNEAARIESCATGGRALASKALLERLDDEDAEVLGISPNSTTYTPLGDLVTATEKARRDAPAIAVTGI